ncbi:MAG: glyoxylate/hydroxypyruvate reductase A [Rhodobacteraceae bacterium]|nr:glyoxylate/hydroxypyruvate reductase A [Paracoccaceae bacterium]
MINVLFAAHSSRWPQYEGPLRAAFKAVGLEVDLREEFAPEDVDYIIYTPNSPLTDFTPYTRAKAVLNLWAGVESIVGNKTLTMPLCRMVEPGLTEGMVEWVTGHVLRYHLGIDACLAAQDGTWAPVFPPLARNRRVGVLGLGELGATCAGALAALNFQVAGWSRSEKFLDGVTTFHGADGLDQVLATSEILVLLLPLTPATENLINADTLARMPQDVRILNPGRGALIDDDALLAALDAGHVAHATLDVFRVEPLPPDHRYWAHPNVTVTPHVASETRAETASETVAENVRRGEAGEPFLYVVDRARAY